jgi:hypothetical protein
MNNYEYLAVVMAYLGITSLGMAEDLFTGVVCKRELSTFPTTPVNLRTAAQGFYMFGFDSPAAIEQVATVFTTHNRAELLAQYFAP